MTFLDSTFWWHLVKTAAIDVCCLMALAFAAHCFVRRAGRQRTVWQITVICLLALPASEWTGFGNATARFLFDKQIAPDAAAEYVSPISQPHIVQQKLILPTTPAQRAIWWPCWVWMCGVTVILGRMAAAQALLVVLRLRREKIASRLLQERVLRIATSVGLRRKIYLFWMPEAICPMAFGVFRPSIGLPPAFERKFTATEQEAILAHELAHLAARDPMWFRLADFASALLWWHPLVWYVRRMLHSASEVAADEATVVVSEGPDALASCLITLGKEMTASHGWGWVGINGGFRSQLGKRVKRLMQISAAPKRPSGGWTADFAKAAAAILIVPSVVLLSGLFQSAQGQKAESWRGQLRDSWHTSPGAILVMAALDDKEKQHPDIAIRIQNAKLLYETGKLDAAKAIFLQVLRDDPANPTAPYYLDLIKAGGAATSTQVSGGTNETLYTKVFKVEPINFAQNLNEVYGTNESPVSNKPISMVQAYFTSAGVDFTYPGKSIFFNDRSGLILVRATHEDLAIIEQVVTTLNQSPSQVMITARIAEVNESILKPIMPDWTNSQQIVTQIITESERQLAVAQIERTDADILQFPKGTTLTGRKIRLGSGDNLSFEFLPIVQADGFSINMTAALSMKTSGKTEAWNIPTLRNMPDGTTLEATLPIESPRSPRLKYIIVFISPRIIDAAGTTMHSDAEISSH
ncbi:MAG TPA: M56 family metallopeptidase [Verrucomicrobiae bacterium]|jgi:beta-lactamase regulating signal transducer with metallopeptidase domain|nr:M56 family metallopeptidase [Verrucomicrobiae bacterium]